MRATLYGFEDYKMYNMSRDFLDQYWMNSGDTSLPVYSYPDYNYIIGEGIPQSKEYDATVFYPGKIIDHKELLGEGKKVYIHKNCSISRSLVSSKYKKTLDPWMADVVVIPKPDLYEKKYWYRSNNVIIFSNDDTKTLFVRDISEYGTPSLTDTAFKNATETTKLGDLIPAKFTSFKYDYYNTIPLTKEEEDGIRNAVLMYKGYILKFEQKDQYIMDIFTNSIPRDKIVFEDTIQTSLGTEDNKITLEALLSIYDMLNSKDDDAVNAGLKALAMMDYAHYSNSIKYMLAETNSTYRWCHAFSSSAVKFMLKTLVDGQRVRRNMYLSASHDIYAEDFELYKQLVMHFDKDNRPLADKLRYINFMTISPEGLLVPRLKETA